MTTAAIISTDRADLSTTGMLTMSSTTYPAAPIGATPPINSQVYQLPSRVGSKTSLLRITPFSSVNNATSTGVRVIGWLRSSAPVDGSFVVPTLLAEVALAYNGVEANIPTTTIDGQTHRFFHGAVMTAGVPDALVYSPGASAISGTPPATLVVDTIGCHLITIHFAGSTGGMGAFYAEL